MDTLSIHWQGQCKWTVVVIFSYEEKIDWKNIFGEIIKIDAFGIVVMENTGDLCELMVRINLDCDDSLSAKAHGTEIRGFDSLDIICTRLWSQLHDIRFFFFVYLDQLFGITIQLNSADIPWSLQASCFWPVITLWFRWFRLLNFEFWDHK